ncbi:extracellular solute-binding protein [Streptomyces shenzhenensis]|uniref:ABC transporter substrate-binding protein n=1 Tax=Streptomyces shenzhenensis TaxID=943815 RepID=UPI0033F3F3D4
MALHRTRTRSRLMACSVIATGALVLSACAGGTGSSGNGASATGSAMTDKEVRAAGDVTLNLTDYLSGSQLDSLKKNIAQFEAEYPNIKINATQKDFASYGKTIALTMSSDTAPDIAQANSAMAPRLVSGNLVRPMDAYYNDYKWGSAYPSGISAGLKLSPNGKTFGEGKHYGMAIGGNMVALYYNKKLLSSYGLKAPTSFEDFVGAMATVKEKGAQALALGGLEQYSLSWTANTVIDHFASADSLNNWALGKKGSSIDSNSVQQGLQTLRDWVEKGYISSSVNGTKDDDASAAFADGKAAFMIAGSWRGPQFEKALGEGAGTMLLPDKNGGQSTANGWFSEAWTISSKSKHADLAAFLLNYLYGPKSSENNIAGGWLPFATGATVSGKLSQELLDAWYTATKSNGLTAYLDNSTPSMGNTYFPGLQAVLAGKQQPSQLTKSMQSNWTSYHTGS